jgi:hypothetical protein
MIIAAGNPDRIAALPHHRRNRLWVYWRGFQSPDGKRPGRPARLVSAGSSASADAPRKPKRPNGELIVRAEMPPEFGGLKTARFSARAQAVEVGRRDQMLVYAVSPWPEESSPSLRVLVKEFPPDRLGQVFSAWAAGWTIRCLVVEGQL